jgi:hypothetical protein
MNVYQEAVQNYARSSGFQLATLLIITALGSTVLAFVAAYFVGRHYPDNLLLRYLAPLLLLVGSGVSLLIGSYASDQYQRLIYAAWVVFLLIGATLSFVVTIILHAFFF